MAFETINPASDTQFGDCVDVSDAQIGVWADVADASTREMPKRMNGIMSVSRNRIMVCIFDRVFDKVS
jgi:hypothetical protein